MRSWYYSRDGEIHGPFVDGEVLTLVRTGSILPDDAVTNDELDFWCPARDVTGFEFVEVPAGQGAGDDTAPVPDLPGRATEHARGEGAPESDTPQREPRAKRSASKVAIPSLALPPGAHPEPPPEPPAQDSPAPIRTRVLETAADEEFHEPIDEAVGLEAGEGAAEQARQQEQLEEEEEDAWRVELSLGRHHHNPRGADYQKVSLDQGSGASDTVADTDEWAPDLTVAKQRRGKRRGRKDRPEISYGGIDLRAPDEQGDTRLWMRLLSVPAVRALLVLYCLALFVFLPTMMMRGCEREERPQERPVSEVARNQTAATVLAQHLAQHYRGSKVLVIMLPEGSGKQKRKQREKLVGGLRRGFDGKLMVQATDYPKFPVIIEAEIGNAGSRDHVPVSWTPPLQYWYSAEVLDTLIEAYPQCDLIVSFVSLPADYAQMKTWKLPPKDRPKFAVAGGDISGLKQALTDGHVVATVDCRPTSAIDQSLPEEEREALVAQQCILVTPGNVEDISRKHPYMFRD